MPCSVCPAVGFSPRPVSPSPQNHVLSQPDLCSNYLPFFCNRYSLVVIAFSSALVSFFKLTATPLGLFNLFLLRKGALQRYLSIFSCLINTLSVLLQLSSVREAALCSHTETLYTQLHPSLMESRLLQHS